MEKHLKKFQRKNQQKNVHIFLNSQKNKRITTSKKCNWKKNTHKKSIISFDNDKRSSKESQLKNVQKAQPTL